MRLHRLACLIALALVGNVAHAAPWTYRGSLSDGGQPANGTYDIRLTLLDANGKRAVVGPITFADVPVENGSFALDVDFGVDLSNASAMKLRTEVGERGAGFVALGEPSAFDAKATLAGVCWDTQGNAGTSASTDFLGTTDNQALNLRTNGARRLLLDTKDNVVGGSAANLANPSFISQTVGGGGSAAINCGPTSDQPCRNAVGADGTTISGGFANSVSGPYGTVGGGVSNQASANSATVAGGKENRAAQDGSTIGGGRDNTANNTHATIGGGLSNFAAGISSTIAGGENGTASLGGAIGGGDTNTAFGAYSAIAGGRQGVARGDYAAVPGGFQNCAGGTASFAAGFNAKVRAPNGQLDTTCTISSGDGNGDEGTFMWSDRSDLDNGFVSTGPNQFLVRAAGGVGINGAPVADNVEFTLLSSSNGTDVANVHLRQRASGGPGILFSAAQGTAGNNDASFFIDHYNGSAQARRLELNRDGSVVIRSNITQTASGVTMAANGGSFTSLSDRNVKTAIVPVDSGSILDKVIALPVSTWSYTAQGEGVRHIGPMAQDFKAAFEVGESDTGITTIDADGVALAAIQGLNRKLEAENAALRDGLAAVQARLEALEQRNR